MLASWNIFKALLPYLVLSAFALLGAWIAIDTVWLVWHYSLPELPANAGFTVFILGALLVLACFSAYTKRKWDEEISTFKALGFIAVLIAACLYLQTSLHSRLVEASWRHGPVITEPGALPESLPESLSAPSTAPPRSK